MDLFVVIVTNSGDGAWVYSDHQCWLSASDSRHEAEKECSGSNVIIETIKIEV